MKIKQLDLLVPEQLPTQKELDEANREKVFLSISIALKSLDLTCQKQAISQVNQALIILGENDILPAILQTQASKKQSKTLDYDNYFNVNHVKSSEPEICLVRSVLVTYKRFLLLDYKSKKFNSENIKIQQQGFRNYFQLLSRVFNLSLN